MLHAQFYPTVSSLPFTFLYSRVYVEAVLEESSNWFLLQWER